MDHAFSSKGESTDNALDGFAKHYLQNPDDVLRSEAVRALLVFGGPRAAPFLVEALLDEDPDIRVDAMNSLQMCARSEDLDSIRESLIGDPMPEVKIAAIKTLANMNDLASIDVLRTLVLDRNETEVVWEDDGNLWDDWLDVQTAAIEALGQMGVTDAIPSLISAREDEFGQDLDRPVFAALAKMDESGLGILIEFLDSGNSTVRQNAITALARANPASLRPFLNRLFSDPNPEIRKLLVGVLDADDELTTRLIEEDPDPEVRAEALSAFGSGKPELIEAALSDSSELVRTQALESLVRAGRVSQVPNLFDNVRAWIELGAWQLQCAAIAVLQHLSNPEVQTYLLELAQESEKPVQTRIAAIKALTVLSEDLAEPVLQFLETAVFDPSQQIRTVVIAKIAELSTCEFKSVAEDACKLLCNIIRGERVPDIRNVDAESSDTPDVAMSPHEEESSSPTLEITPDGEITEVDNEPVEKPKVSRRDFPASTLAALQNLGGVRKLSPTTEEGKKPGRKQRNRVAVDGPADFGIHLRVTAIGFSVSCPSADIEKELADCLYDDEISVKVAAYRTLADRAVTIGLELDDYSQSAEQGLKHDNPEIRRCSVKILIEALPDQFEALVPLLDDPDDLVRAQAYKALLNKYPEIWQSGIEDASSAVKREMFSALSECSSKFPLRDILSKCIEQKQPEALVELINAAPQVKEIVIRDLCSGKCDLQSALIRLLALSSFVQKTT